MYGLEYILYDIDIFIKCCLIDRFISSCMEIWGCVMTLWHNCMQFYCTSFWSLVHITVRTIIDIRPKVQRASQVLTV